MVFWRRCFTAILVLAPLCSVHTQARTVDLDSAERAVRGWLRTHATPLQTALGRQVDAIDPECCADGDLLYYLVLLDPQGFVIVSAEERIEPIIGFGYTTDAALAPGGVLRRLISADMRARLRDCAHTPTATPRAHSLHPACKRKWQQLRDEDARLESTAPQVDVLLTGSASLRTAEMDDIRVPPLTRSKWGQKSVCNQRTYNYYTPQGLPSGCVATAMAQLMLYHQYPLQGIGRHEFAILVNHAEDMAWTRGGDGQGGPYLWSEMVPVPNCSLTDTQRQAMGALCYDAGLSVLTSYEPSASGAYGIDIAQALTDTFLFRSAVTGYNNENNLTSNASLTHMINPNLDAGYPVILGIYGDTGHALIVDGYGYNEETLYHHLNLGFEGTHNVWYNLPDIMDYDVVSHCVYNCFPEQGGEIMSGRVTDAHGQAVAGATVAAVSSRGDFSATTSKQGIYALAGLPSGERYRIAAEKPRLAFRSRMTKLTASEDLTVVTGNRWQIDFRAYAGGDYNRDTRVNLVDFALFAQHWGLSADSTLTQPELHAIADPDVETVEAFDLKLFLLDWLVGAAPEVLSDAR